MEIIDGDAAFLTGKIPDPIRFRCDVTSKESPAFSYSSVELTGRELGAGLIIEAGLKNQRGGDVPLMGG
jgi:hypothetical protein